MSTTIRGWFCHASILVLIGICWVLLTQLAAAAGDSGTATATAAKLVAAQATIEMEVKKSGLLDSTSTGGTATGFLLITNQGTGPASIPQVEGWYSDGTPIVVTPKTLDGKALTEGVPVNGDLSIRLSFEWNDDKGVKGTFIVTAPNNTDPATAGPPLTVPFTIREIVPGSVFGWAAFWCALAAALMTLITWFTLTVKRPDDNQQQESRPSPFSEIYPGATWTFSGSMASSITAIGAILGTVLAASGFLSDVLPGLATGLFTGVNIGYLLVVALAGLVYVASCKKVGTPTYLALLLAASVTLWAVIGELATLALLVARGGLPPPWILGAGIAVLVVLYLYTRRSIAQVLMQPKTKPPKKPESVAEMATVLAVSSEATLALQRAPSALL